MWIRTPHVTSQSRQDGASSDQVGSSSLIVMVGCKFTYIVNQLATKSMTRLLLTAFTRVEVVSRHVKSGVTFH